MYHRIGGESIMFLHFVSIRIDPRSELTPDAQQLFGPHAFIYTPFLVRLVQLVLASPTDTSAHALTHLLKAINCLRGGLSFILVRGSYQIRLKRGAELRQRTPSTQRLS